VVAHGGRATRRAGMQPRIPAQLSFRGRVIREREAP
jgi:hypothetical protein